MIRNIFTLLLVFLFSFVTKAQISFGNNPFQKDENPVEWSFSVEKLSGEKLNLNGTFILRITLREALFL